MAEFAWSGPLAAFLAATCWAVSNIFLQLAFRSPALRPYHAVQLAAVTNAAMLWAAVGIAALLGRAPTIHWGGVAVFALSGLLGPLLGRWFSTSSIQSIGAARHAALKPTLPLFGLMWGLALLRETVAPRVLLGISLVILGLSLVVTERTAGGRGPLRGYVLGVLANLSYALSQTVRRWGLLIMPSPLVGSAVATLAAAVVNRPTGLFGPRGLRVLPRPNFLWLTGYAVMLTGSMFLTFYALTVSPVAIVTALGTMETLLTMVLAHIFLERSARVTRRLVVSALVATVGALLVSL